MTHLNIKGFFSWLFGIFRISKSSLGNSKNLSVNSRPDIKELKTHLYNLEVLSNEVIRYETRYGGEGPYNKDLERQSNFATDAMTWYQTLPKITNITPESDIAKWQQTAISYLRILNARGY